VAAYLLRWDVVPRHPLRLLVARPWPADQQWLRDQYPAIARRARLEGAEIQWAGARALLHAPGQLLSSVSNRGLMRWCSLPAPAQAADWIDFLRRLVAGAPCKLLLIVAAGGLHQELELQRWLAEHEDQIVLLSGPPAA